MAKQSRGEEERKREGKRELVGKEEKPLSLLSISVRPAFTSFRMTNGYGLWPPPVA
jgi:hypothetical protein